MQAALPSATYERLAQQLVARAKLTDDPNEAAELLARAAVWQQLAKNRKLAGTSTNYFPRRSAKTLVRYGRGPCRAQWRVRKWEGRAPRLGQHLTPSLPLIHKPDRRSL